MKRIIEPVWSESVNNFTFCAECHALIKRGDRMLTDRYSHNRNSYQLCETCGQQAIEATSARRIKANKEFQKHDHCPNCRIPYPLTETRSPQNEEDYAIGAVTLLESSIEPCETWPDRTDRVFVCGCREHSGHVAPAWSFCRNHKPAQGQIVFTGCCYVCDYPITSAARTYNRNLRQSDPTDRAVAIDESPELEQAA